MISQIDLLMISQRSVDSAEDVTLNNCHPSANAWPSLLFTMGLETEGNLPFLGTEANKAITNSDVITL
jgi:hypothetical protein